MIPPSNFKEVKKGSGFGKIVDVLKNNEQARVMTAASK